MKKTIISICAASLLCGTVISTPRQAIAGATEAYIAHTAINMAMFAIGLVTWILRITSINAEPPLPARVEASVPVWTPVNIAGVLAPLGQAAITQWMDKSGKILATFTGDEGHVTDKWVGPPEMNTTVYTVEEFAGEVASFNVADVPVVDIAYEGLQDPENSSARVLAEARMAAALAENQSNTGGEE